MSNKGAAFLELYLGGQKISDSSTGDMSSDAERHLLSIELKEALQQLDSVTIKLAVPENFSEVMQYAMPGVDFEVKLGWSASDSREVHGEIVDVTVARSTSAPWVVTLHGLDKLHRAKLAFGVGDYEGTDSDIVEIIAGEMNYTPEIEATDDTARYQSLHNKDFATVLMGYAKKHNYFVRLETDDTLRFGRLSSFYQANSVSLAWGTEIENIQIKYSINGIVTTVKTKSHDDVADEWIEGEATKADLAAITGGKSGVEIVEEAMGDVVLHFDNADFKSTSEANAKAAGELTQRAEKFLTGTVSCIGVPDAVAGAKLTITGAGWPIDGDYVIGETTHSMDAGSGYRTSISFYSDSLPSN